MYGLRNDETTIFNAYIQLLIKAGMINEDSQDIPYMTESCLMLVPTNEAVKQAIVGGKIPGNNDNGFGRCFDSRFLCCRYRYR